MNDLHYVDIMACIFLYAEMLLMDGDLHFLVDDLESLEPLIEPLITSENIGFLFPHNYVAQWITFILFFICINLNHPNEEPIHFSSYCVYLRLCGVHFSNHVYPFKMFLLFVSSIIRDFVIWITKKFHSLSFLSYSVLFNRPD